MTDAVLTINAGSSSIKFALYSLQDMSPLLSGKIVNIGQSPSLKASDIHGTDLCQPAIEIGDQASTHETLISWLLNWLKEHDSGILLKSVGHRVVHGGQSFTEATRVTPSVLLQLKALIPLAPLHQGHNLSAIEAISKWAPRLPQVACFDTSFHHTQSELAKLFAIPRKYTENGIIRYGFHGLSYEYIANQLPKYLNKHADARVIVAHIGNGASMCALKNGRSVASSMGFTALDGLMMGQRCGSLDAGVILHLLQHYKMSAAAIEHMLYKESGLLGVSGISNNMQVLQQSDDPHAAEAINLYCYRAARELSSLVSTLNGLDAIVFTAGIGENSALVREKICEHLAWLGVVLDNKANQSNNDVISNLKSSVQVLIIPTNEELVIAKATKALLE
ncbi:acetate/propionate family kinase [Glaciecola sp. SC05]|uniref:acetate/propionate family kinase n=1 Tax=Glaciecola sp. SC05 TaxID=1987355 RepID=UPI0035294058